MIGSPLRKDPIYPRQGIKDHYKESKNKHYDNLHDERNNKHHKDKEE